MSTTDELVVHGTCHHDCPDSCGWKVTVRDGRAETMRGNPDHPYSKGELCPKVNRFLHRVYSPDRVLHPMRRTGPKGSGMFERISWDDALTEIATRFHSVIEQHGGEAILPYISAGNQGLLSLMFGDRLWHHLGATRVEGALCGAVAGAGSSLANGTSKSLDPSELVHSRLIILWGTNTKLTNRHLWPTIEQARRDGARLVVIDPLRTVTADDADWFIQPLPGTDVALMLAMMHVLIRDGLVDREWVDAHTTGFDLLAAHVREWTPEHAAAVCGIDARDIEELARQYGTIRPAAIRTLIGAEHHEHGATFFRTLTFLPALVGAWRDRGGGYSRSIGVWSNELLDHDALTRPDLVPGHAEGRRPRAIQMPHLGRALTDDGMAPRIHALFMASVNAMVSVPNTELVRAGLERDDLFTVVHDQFLTDTARYADIVLPATTHIEATEVVTSWGHLYIGWNEQAIEPLGEAVSNSELHRRLARALGCTEPALFDDDLTVLRAALPTIDLDELRRVGWVRVPYPDDGRPFGDGVFATASGKVEFHRPELAQIGLSALPTYEPPVERPGGGHGEFALLTPKQHQRFLNSSYSHLPHHGPAEGGPVVELHPDDAQRLGLAEGDTAEVRNQRGSLRLTVRHSTKVRPGVVAVPWGWWHSDEVGGVANSLSSDTLTDWGGGVAYSSTTVDVLAAPRA